MNALDRKFTAQTCAPRSRARRRRDADARVAIRHIVLPGHLQARAQARVGERIGDVIEREGWSSPSKIGRHVRWLWRLPTILVVNGKALPQREWKRRRIRAGDDIAFWSKPFGSSGGSGKSILGIVAAIALAAFAPWAGAAMAGTLGLSAAAWTGIIGLGGSLLIATLTAPKPGGQNAPDAQIDQIYSVQQQGNVARLLQPIPVQYGKFKWFWDYATTPWSEFVGNDEYLNILLGRGEGKYQVHQVLNDDTIVWDENDGLNPAFEGVTLEHYDPNEPVVLFPTNVTSTVEVAGQQLPDPAGINDGWIGGFIANAAGTQTGHLAIDLVWPQGCFGVDGNGNIVSSSVTVVAEYRPVNDAGAPTGSFTTLFSKTFTFNSRSPIRDSVKTEVVPGRYEVRLRRTTAPNSGTNGSNEVAWAGLRAFIVGAPASYPCSTTAIRIKANAFTQQSVRRFAILQTRILPVWDSEEGQWVEQPTRNPYWSFFDAATNADYGARRIPSKIDFQEIVARAAAADAAGVTFDYVFQAVVPAPQALDMILKVDRARHRWAGDILTLVRDEWHDVPRMLLTDREIIRDSVEIKYIFNPDNSADCVVIEYVDEQIWRPSEIQYPPNSIEFTAVNPARFRIEGLTKRDLAQEEAAFYWSQSLHRRINITLETEHDGKLLGYGSAVAVQTELPQSWGEAGAVLYANGNTLTVDHDLSWAESGQHYVQIRTKTGRPFGPVKCSRADADDKILIDSSDLAIVEGQQGRTLAQALERAEGAEEPSFSFGIGQARNCLVMGGQPSGNDRVRLSLVVNSPECYPTDLDAPPALPAPPALQDAKAPLVSFLQATFRQGQVEPILDASWWPSAGAQYYIAEVMYAGGTSWMQVYEGRDNKFSVVVDRAALRLRVQGVGQRRGAYSSVDVSAPDIALAANTVSLESLKAPLLYDVLTKHQARLDRLESENRQIALLAAEIDAAREEDRAETGRDLLRQRGQSRAEFREAIRVAVGPNSAVAEMLQQLNAKVGNVEAGMEARFVVGVTPDGALALYELRLTAGNAFGSQRLIARDDGQGGVYVDIEYLANRFLIRGPDGDAIAPFIVEAGPPQKIYLNGDVLIPQSVSGGFLDFLSANIRILRSDQIDAQVITADNVVSDSLATFDFYNAATDGQTTFVRSAFNPANQGGNPSLYIPPSTQTVLDVTRQIPKGKFIFNMLIQGITSNFMNEAGSTFQEGIGNGAGYSYGPITARILVDNDVVASQTYTTPAAFVAGIVQRFSTMKKAAGTVRFRVLLDLGQIWRGGSVPGTVAHTVVVASEISVLQIAVVS